MSDNRFTNGSGEHTSLQVGIDSVQQLLEALAHPRRRAVVRSLVLSSEETRTFEELVDEVATELVDVTDGVRPLDRDEIATSLHHVHLPKLVDSGLIVHEGDRVEYDGGPAVLEVLSAVEPYEYGRLDR